MELGWKRVSFNQAWQVLSKQKELEFDIETKVHDQLIYREPTVYSFGIPYGGDQYIFDLSCLEPMHIALLHSILEDKQVLKLIHNVHFENSVLYYHKGVIMENIYDTMIAEMVIDSGNETVSYSLLETLLRRLNINISKLLQKSFDNGIVSIDQITYAADDVTYLGFIKRQQLLELGKEDLDWVAALEMDSALMYSEGYAEGFKLDKEKWIENEHLATPVVEKFKAIMDAYLLTEPFYTLAVKSKQLVTEETCVLNWNSHQQVRRIFAHYFPDLTGCTKKTVEQYIKKENEEGGSVRATILQAYLDKDYSTVLDYMKRKDSGFLYNEGVLLVPGTSLVNWNSVDQVMPYARLVHKNIKDLSADSVAKTTHQFFTDLTNYKDALKLQSTYGQAFFKHLEDDGMIRSSVKQLVSTGRISMSKPNMQQVPAKEHLENRYRNAFIPHDSDWVVVDSDFASQELCIIANLSQDPVWIEALRQSKDLHSVCAELVFKDKWKNAAQEGCNFYKKGWRDTKTNRWYTEEQHASMEFPEGSTFLYEEMKGKCKCKTHKTLRDGVKSINFGLAYGMTEFKLKEKSISYSDIPYLCVKYTYEIKRQEQRCIGYSTLQQRSIYPIYC